MNYFERFAEIDVQDYGLTGPMNKCIIPRITVAITDKQAELLDDRLTLPER